MFQFNQDVANVGAPPIPAARAWLRPEAHGDNRRLLDLSQAVPDYPPPQAVQNAIEQASSEPATALYTDIVGLADLREAFAAHQSSFYRRSIAFENIAITAGCNQAFCATIQTLAQAGDDIILPLPYYFNHKMWLDILGVRARHIPFAADRQGIPDIDEFARLIGPRTRAIVIVSPNNPTGATWPPSLLDDLLQLALTHNIALVVDETYKDFHEDGGRAHHFFDTDDWPSAFVQLYSFSKAYSLTGHRVGAVTAGPSFLTELTKVLDCSQICAPHVGQRAAIAGIQDARDFVASKREVMANRAIALNAAMVDEPGGFKLVSCGAYFAYMQHPFGTGKEVARLLAEQQNVLTLPGAMFGTQQEQWLRVAFANVDADAFAEFTQRLTKFTQTQATE